jgi:3-hydroxy-9,10-secoandrosta-1,3,5(10)-triene-9,17-dione monooxygenase reductase component
MAVDPMLYRKVLGHFPTGVTVVTGMFDDEPVGFTIGSFTSVSLDPPLVGFLPMIDSDRWHRIRPGGAFAVNVLGRGEDDLCWRFAKSSIEAPFDGVAWHPGPATGSPVLDVAIAFIDCRITEVVDAGDHHFVMGEVLHLEAVDPSTEPLPLIFYGGKLGEFSPH